ncbi:hypothetical protein MRX96_035564 [Rhipicephalus microplus]
MGDDGVTRAPFADTLVRRADSLALIHRLRELATEPERPHPHFIYTTMVFRGPVHTPQKEGSASGCRAITLAAAGLPLLWSSSHPAPPGDGAVVFFLLSQGPLVSSGVEQHFRGTQSVA